MKDDLEAGLYVPVSEEYLIQGAEIMEKEGVANSAFHKMLDVSNEYKAANLTPFVVYDCGANALICLVKELYGKKLH